MKNKDRVSRRSWIDMHPDLLNWLEDEIDRTIHLLSDSGYNLIDIEHFLVKRFHTICAKHFTAPKVNRKLRPPHRENISERCYRVCKNGKKAGWRLKNDE